MTLAIVYSRASSGIAAPLVTVEAHISNGLPALNIVGLPEAAVKESKDRVRSALMNSQFDFPMRRITINLAPADLPKEGGRFDLPIALGILAASGQIPSEKLTHYEFTGELALSGELRSVRGILPIALGALHAKRTLIVPKGNAQEASLVKGATTFSAEHLLEVCAHLCKNQSLSPCHYVPEVKSAHNALDLVDVRGQPHAKRALEIAAAGRHSLLLMGPPGTGKTMLASRLSSILPILSDEEALEVASLMSISSGGFQASQWRQLPFRSPHHSSSSAALVGGGRPPRPGEISLAHFGILFLDELPEFNRSVLESLREPLESGRITISRAAYQAIFPAQFQLIAAMNPCPCGYAGSPKHTCQCSREQIQRYRAKLSGPLLDRIDMQIEVPALAPDIMSAALVKQSETSHQILARVEIAREQQLTRQGKCNQELIGREIDDFCNLNEKAEALLGHIMKRFNFSARVYHRILKVARTIADLAKIPQINEQHISEALTYRALDKC